MTAKGAPAISVLEALMLEHKIFGRMIDRIEKSFKGSAGRTREEVREALLVLLPALKRHDHIETEVFSHPDYVSQQDAKWLVESVDFEHRHIASLRNEIQSVLQEAEKVPVHCLKALVLLLTHRLRQHFETEEKVLWPHYDHFARRRLGTLPGKRLLAEVSVLAREVVKNTELTSEYLAIRK